MLDAILPNGNSADIGGFRTASEAHEWLGSARHAAWLRDNRVGLGAAAPTALRDVSTFVLALAASPSFERARRTWQSVNAADLARVLHAILTRLVAAGFDRVSAAFKFARVRRTWRAAKFLGSMLRACAVHWRGLIAAAALLAIVLVVLSLDRTEQRASPRPIAARPIALGPRLDRLPSLEAADVPDEIARLIDRLSSEPAAEPLVSRPEIRDDTEVEAQAAPPRPDSPTPSRPAIVGVWVPEPASCSTRVSGDGIIRAVINTHGARAGDTSCTFKSRKQSESDWRMRARCSNARESWTTDVRLTVKGDRLIWTSKRGTQVYTRCRSEARTACSDLSHCSVGARELRHPSWIPVALYGEVRGA